MNDHTLEGAVRDALRDAADHAPLVSSSPVAETPHRVTTQRRRGSTRVMVAVCAAVVVVLAVGALVVEQSSPDSGVRVATPATEPREVPVDALPRAESNLFVYFQLDATDEQVAAVRATLDASPDVTQYAFLDHDAAKRDFDEVYSCIPDLTRSIQPQELEESFRVATPDEQATVRVQTALGTGTPGVALVATTSEVFPGPASSDGVVTSGASGAPTCDSGTALPSPAGPVPTTTPPTLPPAGDPPADVSSARGAVVAAFTPAWNGTSSIEQRRAAMQGSDQLTGALDQARQGNETTIASMRAVLGDVTFVAPDRAAVVFHLEFDGGLIEPTQIGYAVLEDGAWKVSRETVCAVLSSIGGVSCPS